ncbi:MAG: alpha/beta hydrolase [Solirubrobacteraceae bacterium]|nr:alpha/beta hydrolase [Patulibacter sp.]
MARFTTSDGVAIHYDFDDSAPAGQPPVVLQHGFAVSGFLNFGGPGLIDALADADRRTLTIDARGHGDSDTPDDPSRYGEARMALDTRELLDHLGLEEVDLVGYSMGSIIAVLLASEDARVRRMVLGGVGAGVVELGGLDTRQLPPDILVQALRAEHTAQVEHPLGQAWRAFAMSVEADLPALASQAAAMHQAPIALDAITAETLVLVASDDGLADRPDVLAAAIPGAQLEVLPGDHLGVVRHPRFVPAIVEFLAGERASAAE